MIKVAVVYHSGLGHTKMQAEAVARGAQSEQVSVEIFTVAEAGEDIDLLESADAIIFGCPTYMGNVSADMKKFQEIAASKWFSMAWKNKIAGAFTNSGSFAGDKLNTLTSLFINAMQHGMIYVGLAMLPSADDPDSMENLQGPSSDNHNRVGASIGPMASSFQVNPPHSPGNGDIATAEAYGKRIADITLQFKRGR
ncbi:MAG: flavodoxin family protein [Gammaproteobacteria bacterium]|nr:flavodoxin family protein [Gammaproteobacteria bacterium]NNC98060.1 flavodoxin family protein [Gammaproteobacteria bacterium]NNM14610.1 flavodoxin family protein [Gammaproteobacteria bacterium]